jgi:hypothetical protein
LTIIATKGYQSGFKFVWTMNDSRNCLVDVRWRRWWDDYEEGIRSVTDQIAKWRIKQIALMPALTASLGNRVACEIENEPLYLPSDFEQGQRDTLGLTSFGKLEARLREGIAYDALEGVRVAAATQSFLREKTKRPGYGYVALKQSFRQSVDTQCRRDKHINDYMLAHTALMKLGACTGEADDFPAFTMRL